MTFAGLTVLDVVNAALILLGPPAIAGVLYAFARRLQNGDDARAARVARFGEVQVQAAEEERWAAESAGSQ